jgi:hypothetical protein
MRCLHCGKRIGLLRGLKDRQLQRSPQAAGEEDIPRMARRFRHLRDGWVVTANEIEEEKLRLRSELDRERY